MAQSPVSRVRLRQITLIALLTFFIPLTVAVKHHDFKTCAQSGFCKRNRDFAQSVSKQGLQNQSQYQLLTDTLNLNGGRLQGVVSKSLGDGLEDIRLPIEILFLDSGVVRVTLDEEKRVEGTIALRHNSTVKKQRYNEAEVWALAGPPRLSNSASFAKCTTSGVTNVSYGTNGEYSAIIHHSPLALEFQRGGETHVQLNAQGLLNIEHWRAERDVNPEVADAPTDGQQPLRDTAEAPAGSTDESTWWDETFNGNTDTKPRGPESVALDITFPGYEHVYGIPEHAESLALKDTEAGSDSHSEPYRLYNSDVFEYELYSPMTLYGSIPFLQAHRRNSTVGVLWLNAAETWIDIKRQHNAEGSNTRTHWMSESGVLDVFVFLGPTPEDIAKDYGALTGYTQLPQQFALAYHQSRWNYVTDEDVKDVDRKFDMYEIPYDVIWLDIEYTDDKKYFTWDPLQFPDPIAMQEQLDASDRKLVIIIDPHIKKTDSYPISSHLRHEGLAMKSSTNQDYEGWCWPGSSNWIDAFNPAARQWWQSLFQYDQFPTCRANCFIWNDMNEPSVFSGPDMTAPRDNIHFGGWEHRDVHNLNGLTFVNATYHGLLSRQADDYHRPFVLTRSFFAGSQRMGAMWTGDNQAQWEHLAISIPMVLTNGVAGFPFAGADIGGFFGDPSKELLTRWYQAGIWYPFMRAHAHIDTRRREPYVISEPFKSYIAQAIRLRYALLPTWYTAFQQASVNGSPVLRPQFYVHPGDEAGFAIDDQFYLGSSGLLIKPITSEGATSTDIYLADKAPYYDYFDYTVYQGAGKRHTVDAPIDKIPVLMQAGHIVTRKDRPRRSSGLMKYDDLTLVVVLDQNGEAQGTFYEDDGDSYDFEAGAYIHRRFSFADARMVSENLGQEGAKTADYLRTMGTVQVEKIIIVGVPSTWSQKHLVSVAVGSQAAVQIGLQYHAAEGRRAAYAVVKNPAVPIGTSWVIDFS
ncbi:hypothetical protein KEM52_001142 [Ascosphaera acerosa]|nr:hypothetical protein KEM52_001142 [Ascosphaera acerosa]